MSRDPHRFRAFVVADALVVELYRATRDFPAMERFGLQSQLRRGAVSVAANFVEGCARPSQNDFAHFVTIALSSASEVRYLVDLAGRLDMVAVADAERLTAAYGAVIRQLQALLGVLRSGRKPKAESRKPVS
ncbi:MAG TPA: four helix bundle protein [Candidatus Binatia bacterium]|nr:four helix bundle protein [Candidatus Binatia bacterium]